MDTTLDGYDSTDPSYDAIASDPYAGTPQADVNAGAVDSSLGLATPQNNSATMYGPGATDTGLSGLWNGVLGAFGLATDYTLTQQQLASQQKAQASGANTFLGSLGLINPATGQMSPLLLLAGAAVLILMLRH